MMRQLTYRSPRSRASARRLRGSAISAAVCAALCAGSWSGFARADASFPAAYDAKSVAVATNPDCNCDVVTVHMGKAYPIELPREARDVMISDPTIVDVVLRTARQPVLFASKIGQANILFFDEANKKIRSVEVRVEYDAGLLNEMIRRDFPGAQVHAKSSIGEIILSGSVRSSVEAGAIVDLAERFVAAARTARSGQAGAAPVVNADATGVVNRITILNDEQIYLQVRVAELSRSLLKELGLDWNAQLEAASFSSLINFKAGNLNSFAQATNTQLQFGPQALNTFIKALEQFSFVRTLAEPSLTAVSGESASFLAGGEFPIPVPGDDGTTIEYKRFGVALDFRPVVVGDGRVSMKIATEVSALSTEASVTVNGFNIPSLTVRRADTTVEVNSGGTIMIAGLIQSETRRLSAGLPGLRSLPVLGQFFRSENTEGEETELVVLVTPYTVRPGAPDDFTLPTDGFTPAGDLDIYLFGRLHSVYGSSATKPDALRARVEDVAAPVGYIME